jgi:UPF0176 protein
VRDILNISAYRFTPLADMAPLRERLLAAARQRELKGTVLLAEEGINLFLAGTAPAVRGWLDDLRADPRFASLDPKESWSDTVPFKRLVVKVKREIIRMDGPAVRPAQGRAPAIAPRTLARWLAQGHDDKGNPVVLLDTRNAFEVDAGRFEGTIDWRLAKFSDFPAALEARRGELEGKTVVSYCTGGIRCEKAALVMREQGLDAWQLEGGILHYFDQTDGAPHWRGDCFVFDQRIALDSALEVSS